jgi:hypothetical protein
MTALEGGGDTMLTSGIQHDRPNRSIQSAIAILVTLALLLGAAAPAAAAGRSRGASAPQACQDGLEEAVKDLAEQPLTSTPLRLRSRAVEILRPVAREDGKWKSLPLAMVDRLAEDSAFFFDEGRITDSAVLAHDRKLIYRLHWLLKYQHPPAEENPSYLQGLLDVLLADRQMAELALQDARAVMAGVRRSHGLMRSDVARANAYLHASELHLRYGLSALRRGDANRAAEFFEKSWELSAKVSAIWELTYDGDLDGDGLVDVVEMRIGSSPLAADTDDDDLPDWYEFNTLIPFALPNAADSDQDRILDGNEDPDEDGLSNLSERELGTDPLSADTDADGLTDGEEAAPGTSSPVSADLDADGLTDDAELRLGTDPSVGDSDGDGIPDGEDEVFQTIDLPDLGLVVGITGVGDHSRSFQAHSLAGVSSFDSVPGLVGSFIDLSSELPLSLAAVRLHFDPSLVPNGDLGNLRLFRYDTEDAVLEMLPDQLVDPFAAEVSGNMEDLAPLGLIYLPQWEEAQSADPPTPLFAPTDVEAAPPEEEPAPPDEESPVPTAEPTPGPEPLEPDGLETPPEPSFQVMAAPGLGCDAEKCVFQVSGGSSDAGTDPRYTCSYSTGANEIYFGQCPNGQNITSGFRFTNVAIPQGTQIGQAYLDFTVDGPYDETLSLAIYGQASGHALPFSSVSRPDQRPLTLASAAWSIPASDHWELGETRQSPDLTAAVQEILSRPDWVAGNAMAIIVKNVGPASGPRYHRRVIGFERPVWFPGVDHAARLVIVFGTPDSDYDGLTDQQERAGFRTQFGSRVYTDPFKLDTDGDGIPDGDEVLPGASSAAILADPARVDTDGDGLDDFMELRHFESALKPFDPDSDDDGLSDGQEVNVYGTDPFARDSDGDGLGDGDEIGQGLDPLLNVPRIDPLVVAREFAIGALCGEFCIDDPAHANIPFFSGFLISGLISVIPTPVTIVIGLIADLRDFFASLVKGDWGSLAINTVALIPDIGDAADVLGTVTKIVLKYPAMAAPIVVMIARLDWLPDAVRRGGLAASFGEELIDALVNKGLDLTKLQRLARAGVDLASLNTVLGRIVGNYPGIVDFLKGLPANAIDDTTGILRTPGLTANLKLAAATNSARAINGLIGAYGQWLLTTERLAQGWRVVNGVTQAIHVNAHGYDLAAASGDLVRLFEAKAVTSLGFKQISNYVTFRNGRLLFNAGYFARMGGTVDAAAGAAYRAGKLQVEIYINSPHYASIIDGLRQAMHAGAGQPILAAYRVRLDSGEEIWRTVEVILTGFTK